ncbi:sugar ABC transporter ATP-binding protein [Arthrobacter sp. NPDC080073]|uniref:sugar ABC transporter ATP-binding protein n=1 Tax=Arthrobacter sp. NPDC080073 TaxID=3155919 RepID=UPI003438C702
MENTQPALEVQGIVKSFGANRALEGVSFRVEHGKIHALLGANGAGKSTLIKILSGIHAPDHGTVVIGPEADARPGKLSVVHQDLGLVDALSIRENLALGRPGQRMAGFLLDHAAERRETVVQLLRVDLDLDPERSVGTLTLGEKTLVAIAKTFADEASVILLDEVTAALTRAESDWLLREVRQYVDRGGAAVLVSHRLHEVVEHCDRVTLLKQGRVAFDGTTPSLGELHDLLVSQGSEYHRVARPPGRPTIQLSAAVGAGVGPINLEVHAGEVVALVGPLSSGLYRIGHLIAGREKLESGTIATANADGKRGTVAFVPEDRRSQAVLSGLDVRSNTTVGGLVSVSRLGVVNNRRERDAASDAITRLKVHPLDQRYPILGLSGGNQQKVVMARARLRAPDVFVMCEPTRGVDVATRVALYEFIDEVSAEGAAVIVLTIDADDALAVADRVALVRDGRIASILARDELSAERLLEEAL